MLITIPKLPERQHRDVSRGATRREDWTKHDTKGECWSQRCTGGEKWSGLNNPVWARAVRCPPPTKRMTNRKTRSAKRYRAGGSAVLSLPSSWLFGLRRTSYETNRRARRLVTPSNIEGLEEPRKLGFSHLVGCFYCVFCHFPEVPPSGGTSICLSSALAGCGRPAIVDRASARNSRFKRFEALSKAVRHNLNGGLKRYRFFA